MPRASKAPTPRPVGGLSAAGGPGGGGDGRDGTAPTRPPARLPEAGARDVLYLVDLSGYVFRAYHALPPLSNSRGEPTHAVLGTVNMLQKVVAERRPHLFVVAMDSRARTFRHDLDARYKATRPAPPPDLSQQMARVEEIVRAWDVACFARDGFEADDLIASVTARAMGEGWRVVIVSSDKDLMQLVHDDDERIVLWDSMRDRVYGPREVREKLGVAPSQVRDFLALTGDTSDNIPGVPGVGPKTASDLLAQFGSIEGMYANVDQVAKPKLRENLKAHEGDARVSQRLVTLDASTVVEWDRSKLLWGGANVRELRRLYTELEFQRQLDQLDTMASYAASDAPEGRGGSAERAGAPSAAPEPATRVYEPVLDTATLERVVAQARERGQIGIAVAPTSDDAMRADILGVSVAAEPGRGYYVPMAHRYLGAPKQLDWSAVRAALGPILGDPAVAKVGFDVKRAAIVLRRFGAPLVGPTFDVQVAAYLLDPESPNGLKELSRRELGVAKAPAGRGEEPPAKARASQPMFDEIDVERATEMAAPDAELPVSLRARLEPRLEVERLAALMRDVEVPLEGVLAAMEMRGVLVDVPILGAIGQKAEEQLRELESACKQIAGRDWAVRSRDQLEKILFDELRLPVVKRTPKGGRSTDADVLEALSEHHDLPKRLLEFRELDKLKGTYIDALPRYVNPATGRIHTRFDQAVAATGRLSSADPNLQNIPIRTELGRAIRGAFVAPPGHVILSADYSQIELRVLAHLAQDAELVDAFATGEDVHVRTAALVFDKPREQVTADERRAAKTINFGVIYGMGDSALAKQLGIPREQAARFIAAYFTRYSGVARFMEKSVDAARQGGEARTLLGRRRFLPNLHSANRALRFEAERIARNTPIQGTAADILKLAMIDLGREATVEGASMVLTVHDELVFEVPEGDAKRASEAIRARMASAMKLAVPLVVDVGWGKSWADAH
jgi:DNA polymerase-1